MTNGEDYPSLIRLLNMLELGLLPQPVSQASADSSDTAVSSAGQHPGSVIATPPSALNDPMQMSSGRAISSTDTSIESAQATAASAPPLAAPPPAAPPLAALPLAAPPVAAPPVAALPVAALPRAAPLAAPPQEQSAIPMLDTVDGITTAIRRPEQPADVTGLSKALPGVESAAQFERESQTRSSIGTGTSEPIVMSEQLAAMHAAQSDLQALGTGTEDPLPQAPEAAAGEKSTSEAGQEVRTDMQASHARMNAAASDGKAAADSEASPQAHRRPLASP